MSITKRGSIVSSDTPLVVVLFSFICGKCGHTLTVDKDLINNKCKKCSEGIMIMNGAVTNIKKD